MQILSSAKKIFETGLDLEINNLRSYAETLEESLTEQLNKFTLSIEDRVSQLPAEVREDFYEFYSEDYWKLSEVFPNTLRYSLFVTCYSLLEYELIHLCQYISDKGNPPNPVEFDAFDLKTSPLDRVKNYFKEVGITFPKDELWQKIRNYQKLRNGIVHNGGELDISGRVELSGDPVRFERQLSEKQKKLLKKQRHIKKFVNSTPSLSIGGMNKIQFLKEFNFEVIDDVESFLKKVYKTLPDSLFAW